MIIVAIAAQPNKGGSSVVKRSTDPTERSEARKKRASVAEGNRKKAIERAEQELKSSSLNLPTKPTTSNGTTAATSSRTSLRDKRKSSSKSSLRSRKNKSQSSSTANIADAATTKAQGVDKPNETTVEKKEPAASSEKEADKEASTENPPAEETKVDESGAISPPGPVSTVEKVEEKPSDNDTAPGKAEEMPSDNDPTPEKVEETSDKALEATADPTEEKKTNEVPTEENLTEPEQNQAENATDKIEEKPTESSNMEEQPTSEEKDAKLITDDQGGSNEVTEDKVTDKKQETTEGNTVEETTGEVPSKVNEDEKPSEDGKTEDKVETAVTDKVEENNAVTNEGVTAEDKGDNNNVKSDSDTPLCVGKEGDLNTDVQEETEQKSES